MSADSRVELANSDARGPYQICLRSRVLARLQAGRIGLA